MVALSLLAKDILWLRVLSVISSCSAIVFNYNAAAAPLWTPIRWNLFFIGLNIFHISKILLAKKNVQLTEKQEEIYQWFFRDLNRVEFYKFISAGHSEKILANTVLTKEGEEVHDLWLIYSGRIDILKNQVKVSELKDGHFLGEMSFLSNLPATATAITHFDCEVIKWNQKDLKSLLAKSPSLIYSLQSALGAQLSRVLEEKNDSSSKGTQS